MINIIRGTTSKPVSTELLLSFFNSYTEADGTLFTGFPVLAGPSGLFSIDALWISPSKGAVIFILIEGKGIQDFERDQDDSVNILGARLRRHRELMNRRELNVPVEVISFAPAVRALPEGNEYRICNSDTIQSKIESLESEFDNADTYRSLISVVQSVSTIRKGNKKREISKANSRGAILKSLEDSISNLDNQQGRAVIETVDGVQRIRGLAGSGKTIVLALKAAYLHVQHPEWKIAVTFNSRSLKGQFRQLITTFSIEQTNEEPNWDNLQILHAWGAQGGNDRTGMYYLFCSNHNIKYHDYGTAKRAFGQGNEFGGACSEALAEWRGLKEKRELFDVILVDEAQDFPSSFLCLCYEFLKDEKRLVYAYDELQNLGSGALPPPEKIFGSTSEKGPRVTLANENGKPKKDIILEKCYRNSRPVLVTAHALGFGIYREPSAKTGTGLVQIFDDHKLWKDVGYEVTEGKLDDGQRVKLARTSETSPEFLESHSSIDDLVKFLKFSNPIEQAEWVAKEIQQNLQEDEMLHDDIIVINTNPLSTRTEVSAIRNILFDMNINSHLVGVDTSPDVFRKSVDSIVFTGIHRAKGNEAGMVYIINSQDCSSPFGRIALIRNRLFTAITRSKAWVRILGIGSGMQMLIDEFNKIKENDFKLDFVYPTSDQRRHLSIIHREITSNDARRLRDRKTHLKDLLNDLENGRIYMEDLGDAQIEKLRGYLNGGSKDGVF